MLRFDEVLSKALEEPIDREEALYLFRETEDHACAEELMKTARSVREKAMGNVFRWSAGIASVLRCRLKPLCGYCPYWRGTDKKPLTIPEILKGVEYIVQHGIKEFHLSGGTTLRGDGRDMLEIIQAIRHAGYEEQAIDVNCGAAVSLQALKEFKQLNVRLVRSVFETVNPEVFKRAKPGDDLDEKKKFAHLIGEAGLEFGTGIMAGLSPQASKYQDYVDFMFHVKTYAHLTSVYVSKFFPVQGIPMEQYPQCSQWEAARVISVMRLVLRDIEIGAAAGWERHEHPTPLLAGSGNRVGGIHINRAPQYDMTPSHQAHCFYQDNLEFYDNMEDSENHYREFGIRILA
ncbi:MAG: radical SAM protein [Desulfitobacteriaceae bacterium]|nr:radical SAM protein [Desulfitobacteriaceae bacterium]MDI6879428.1 radical SAM protein [Desulfitobacteriaceae bacterium]MDI6914706.1 radical SAM protein [Desulfitobacteriaceae bacterium]